MASRVVDCKSWGSSFICYCLLLFKFLNFINSKVDCDLG